MPRAYGWRPLISALALCLLAGLGLPVAVRAQTTCSAECDNDLGCNGDCEINPPDGCGSYCFDAGCSVTCKSFGPNCDGGGTTQCFKRDPPPVLPAGRPAVPPPAAPAHAGWAVLSYVQGVDLKPSDIRVVRASSDEFGALAQSAMARREDDALAASRAASPGGKAAGLGAQTEVLYVADVPNCEQITGRLGVRTLAGVHPDQSLVVYFRGNTDGTGKIVTTELLHTTASDEAARQLIAFGEQNLKVWSKARPAVPIEFYGSLRVTPSGAVGYLVEGGSPILN